MSFDFNTITSPIGNQVQTAQTTMAGAAESLKANPNDIAAQQKLLQATNNWSNMCNLQSALIKAMGDAIRGIIQKMP